MVLERFTFYAWIEYIHDLCKKCVVLVMWKYLQNYHFYAMWCKPIRLWRICHNIIVICVAGFSILGKIRGVHLLLAENLLHPSPPPHPTPPHTHTHTRTHAHTHPEGKKSLKTPTKFHYSHCNPIDTSCLAVVIAPVSCLFYLHTLCTEYNWCPIFTECCR